MNIVKILTKYNLKKANRTKKDIQYIVIHYIGGLSSAKNNADYWSRQYTGNSAHYIIGHEGEVYQIVEDKDIAWHCGAKKYVHPKCRNSNSIGIEMCVRKKDKTHIYASDKDWYFEDATVESTIKLTQELMDKYNIPIENVVRHYDITNKTCPAPYVHEYRLWDNFKKKLRNPKTNKSSIENKNTHNKELIKELQNALNEDGFTDGNGKRLIVDGLYGDNTESALGKVVLKITKDSNGKLTYVNPTSKGEMVKFIQKVFNRPVDGLFGKNTKYNVQKYQKNHGMVKDGIVGKTVLLEMIGE